MTMNTIISSHDPTAPTAVRPINQIVRWAGRTLLGLLALLIGLALIGASYEGIMAAGDDERYPPPGQLVRQLPMQLSVTRQG